MNAKCKTCRPNLQQNRFRFGPHWLSAPTPRFSTLWGVAHGVSQIPIRDGHSIWWLVRSIHGPCIWLDWVRLGRNFHSFSGLGWFEARLQSLIFFSKVNLSETRNRTFAYFYAHHGYSITTLQLIICGVCKLSTFADRPIVSSVCDKINTHRVPLCDADLCKTVRWCYTVPVLLAWVGSGCVCSEDVGLINFVKKVWLGPTNWTHVYLWSRCRSPNLLLEGFSTPSLGPRLVYTVVDSRLLRLEFGKVFLT